MTYEKPVVVDYGDLTELTEVGTQVEEVGVKSNKVLG